MAMGRENKGPLSSLWHSQDMYCVEIALFKSSGDICWIPLPSSLLDKLSVNKRDSDGFFSRRLPCRSSDRSYNLTDSVLNIVTVSYSRLLDFFMHTNSACWLGIHVVCCNYVFSVLPRPFQHSDPHMPSIALFLWCGDQNQSFYPLCKHTE